MTISRNTPARAWDAILAVMRDPATLDRDRAWLGSALRGDPLDALNSAEVLYGLAYNLWVAIRDEEAAG